MWSEIRYLLICMIENLFRWMRDDEKNIAIWSRDLENHFHGEFSSAMISAKAIVEDQSLVEAGRRATFVGVYDGHGGFEASRYVCDELYHHLLRLAIAEGAISEEIIRNAFEETENGFLSFIRRDFACNQLIAACGSCCLVGVIRNETLYTANLGDSRAVIGYVDAKGVIVGEQLTSDHNANARSVRKELRAAHPKDKHIVGKRKKNWRVKGRLQVSRSAYLKDPDLAIGPDHQKYHLKKPLTVSVLRADPDIHIRQLQTRDKFIIYASNGLWNVLTKEEAVEIVKKNPRSGIARRLIVSALRKVAIIMKMESDELMQWSEWMKECSRSRRNYHDDISVVVIFIDQDNADFAGGMSVRGLCGFSVSTSTSGVASTFDF